jgi:hypothetical protein
MNGPDSKLVRMPETDLEFGNRPFSLRELFDASLPKPKELVSNLLFEGETVAFVARPKTGKTRLAQQLALAVAGGTEFLGQKVLRATPVLYIDLESNPSDARERLAKIGGRSSEMAMERLHIYSVRTLGDSKVGLVGQPLQKLREMIESLRIGLLIIDTWRLISIGKENEAEHVVENLKAIDSLRTSNPTLTILLIHHLRKSDPKGRDHFSLRSDPQAWLDNVSGSHAFVAHTDTAIGFEREATPIGDVYVLAGVRRNGPPPMFVLQSDEESLRFEPLDDEAQLATMIFTEAQLKLWRSLPNSFTWSDAERIADGRKHILSVIIHRAENNGLLDRPSKGCYTKSLAPARKEELAA